MDQRRLTTGQVTHNALGCRGGQDRKKLVCECLYLIVSQSLAVLWACQNSVTAAFTAIHTYNRCMEPTCSMQHLDRKSLKETPEK